MNAESVWTKYMEKSMKRYQKRYLLSKANLTDWLADNIVILLYGVTLLAMCIFLRNGSAVINYIRYIYCALIMLVVIFRKRTLVVNKFVAYIVGGFVLHSVLFCFLIVPSSFRSAVIDNGKEMIVFWLFVFCTAQYVHATMKQKEFLLTTFFVFSLYMIVVYLTNFNGWAPIKFLPQLLGLGGIRVRFDFGFESNNQAAYLSLCLFVLSVLVWRTSLCNNKVLTKDWTVPKLYVAVACIVSILMMLSTQTRGALMLALLFWLMPKLMNRTKIITKSKHRVALAIVFLVAFLVVYFYFVYFAGDSRTSYLTHNVEIFVQYSNRWIGMGYAPFSAFLNQMYGYATMPMDNYYLYILCATGYVGLAIVVTLLVSLVIYLSRLLYHNSHNYFLVQVVVIFFMLLLMGVTEAGIIYTFSIYSSIYWMLIILSLMDVKQVKHVKHVKYRDCKRDIRNGIS